MKDNIGKPVTVQVLVDTKSMFGFISNGSRTSKKRNMPDITAARLVYHDGINSDIGLVRSNNELSDVFTKLMSQSALRDTVCNAHLNLNNDQWIVRSMSGS